MILDNTFSYLDFYQNLWHSRTKGVDFGLILFVY